MTDSQAAEQATEKTGTDETAAADAAAGATALPDADPAPAAEAPDAAPTAVAEAPDAAPVPVADTPDEAGVKAAPVGTNPSPPPPPGRAPRRTS